MSVNFTKVTVTFASFFDTEAGNKVTVTSFLEQIQRRRAR